MLDLNSLQQNLQTNVTSNVHDLLVTWVLIPSVVLTALFLAIYIAHVVHRHKVEHAIFEIRDILRDMQAGQVPAKPVKTAAEQTASKSENQSSTSR